MHKLYHKCFEIIFPNFTTLDDFKKVSKAVAGVELNDHLVDLVFVIFDENGTLLCIEKIIMTNFVHTVFKQWHGIYIKSKEASQSWHETFTSFHKLAK